MNLKGKRIEVMRPVRNGTVRTVYEIAAWSMVPALNSFALLVVDVETGEIDQLSVGEAPIKIVPGPEPAPRAVANNAQCEALSSVTGQRCQLSSGHDAWHPTRYHMFPDAYETKPTSIEWIEHKISPSDVNELRKRGVHVVEDSDVMQAPTPDLSGALAHTAAERDTALARVAELERSRAAIQADANKALEAKREAVAQYERIAAEADRKLAELRRKIATLTQVPTFMPSLTEGTEERDGRLFYTQGGDEVQTYIDGAAYKEWAQRLVAERNEARRCCLELQNRIEAFTAGTIVGVAGNGDRLTS